MPPTSSKLLKANALSERLVEKAKDGDSDSLKLVTAYCKKYICTAIKNVIVADGYEKAANDVYNDRFLIVWKCLQSFNPEKKAAFSTWVYQNVVWECLRVLKRQKAREDASFRFLDDPSTRFYEDSAEKFEQEEEKIYFLQQIDKKCTKIEKKILTERFFRGRIRGFPKIGKTIGRDYRSVKKIYLETLNKLNIELYEQ